jgi:hypothetical protein
VSDPDLYVDLPALEELVRQLGQIRASLEKAGDRVDAFDARLRSERIEEALNDFVSGWKDGRRKIIEGIDALLGKCQGAADTYADQEQAVIKATGQQAGG